MVDRMSSSFQKGGYLNKHHQDTQKITDTRKEHREQQQKYRLGTGNYSNVSSFHMLKSEPKASLCVGETISSEHEPFTMCI